MIAAAQPFWIVALAAFVTNLRFVIYSASLRRWFEAYSQRRRAVLGYFTGDFTFAMFMNRVTREGEFPHRDAWFLGACGCNWVLWQVTSIVGIVAATAIHPQIRQRDDGTVDVSTNQGFVPATRHRSKYQGKTYRRRANFGLSAQDAFLRSSERCSRWCYARAPMLWLRRPTNRSRT